MYYLKNHLFTRKVRDRPELYNKFVFHHPPTTNFFLGFEVVYTSWKDLGWVGMTQVWSEEVRTS